MTNPSDQEPPTRNPAGQEQQGRLAPAQLSEDVLVGAVLDKRYRIVRLLGEGGMGKVYEAEHIGLGRKVAVKVLHPIYSKEEEVVERFRREARSASSIGHPNIVDVTDTGTTDDGRAFFVMEHLDGMELADVIIQQGRLDPYRAIQIAVQICQALSAAHKVGVVHRDLKPENVFLTDRDGRADFVKVLDFGIAKSTHLEMSRGGLTQPGFAMGTPEYMAPEQAAGMPVDPRVDIYATGGILYAMLTGQPPHSGKNVMEILNRKATEQPEPISHYRDDVPKGLQRVVMSALAMKPESRPQTMEQFEYALRKFLSGRPAAVAALLGIQGAAGEAPGGVSSDGWPAMNMTGPATSQEKPSAEEESWQNVPTATLSEEAVDQLVPPKSPAEAIGSWQDAPTVSLPEAAIEQASSSQTSSAATGWLREASTVSLPEIVLDGGVASTVGRASGKESAGADAPGGGSVAGGNVGTDEPDDFLDPATSETTPDPPLAPMTVSQGPVESEKGLAESKDSLSMEVSPADLPTGAPDEMAWSEIGTHTVVTDLPSTFRWGWLIGVLVVAAISVTALLLWVFHRQEGHADQAPLVEDGSTSVAQAKNQDAAVVHHDARAVKAPAVDASRIKVMLSRSQFRHVLSKAWKAARHRRWSKPDGDNLIGYLEILDTQKRGARSLRKLRRYAHDRLLRKAARALKRGDLAVVEVAYRNMLAINPGNRSVKWSLVRILLRRSRRLLDKNPKTASVLAGEAVVLVGTASARLAWANALAASGHVDQAVGEYHKVAASRGVSRLLRRRASKALAKLKKAGQRGAARARPRS